MDLRSRHDRPSARYFPEVVAALRALPVPAVAAPLTWDEVEAAAGSGDAARVVCGGDDVLDRIARHGDLFAAVLTHRQRLPPSGSATG